MTNEEFDLIVEKTNKRIKGLMVRKGTEYSGKVDRLENFKRASGAKLTTPEDSLFCMVNKHWVSIAMMVETPNNYDLKQWRAKVDDVLVYMLLLTALLEEYR